MGTTARAAIASQPHAARGAAEAGDGVAAARSKLALRWPLPALLAWCLAWAVHAILVASGAAPWLAIGAAGATAALLAMLAASRWRRLIVAAGYPLSLFGVALAGALPGWAWLAPLAVLGLLYPLRTWRDAPFFPTPAGALDGLSRAAPLAPGARIVDLGCGLGDGLRALQRAYPQAAIDGVEWSRPLQLVCALRCRDANVSRADLWAAEWSGYDLVYLFQRPESMARAIAKAGAELRPGAWLASLEFDAPGVQPQSVLEGADGRRVWLYRAPFIEREAS